MSLIKEVIGLIKDENSVFDPDLDEYCARALDGKVDDVSVGIKHPTITEVYKNMARLRLELFKYTDGSVLEKSWIVKKDEKGNIYVKSEGIFHNDGLDF